MLWGFISSLTLNISVKIDLAQNLAIHTKNLYWHSFWLYFEIPRIKISGFFPNKLCQLTIHINATYPIFMMIKLSNLPILKFKNFWYFSRYESMKTFYDAIAIESQISQWNIYFYCCPHWVGGNHFISTWWYNVCHCRDSVPTCGMPILRILYWPNNW